MKKIFTILSIIFFVTLALPYSAEAAPKCTGSYADSDVACYTTSGSSGSCTWVPSGVICDNVNPDGSWAGSVFHASNCGQCPSSYYNTCHGAAYVKSPAACGGTWCDNAGALPDPGTWSTVTNTCHYLRVSEWTPCNPNTKEQVAVSTEWAHVNGTNCQNEALTKACCPAPESDIAINGNTGGPLTVKAGDNFNVEWEFTNPDVFDGYTCQITQSIDDNLTSPLTIPYGPGLGDYSGTVTGRVDNTTLNPATNYPYTFTCTNSSDPLCVTTSDSINLRVSAVDVPGCIDIDALNYNAGATYDDGTCAYPVCGDGLVQGSETCDDGNAVDGDTCPSSCQCDAACTTVSEMHYKVVPPATFAAQATVHCPSLGTGWGMAVMNASNRAEIDNLIDTVNGGVYTYLGNGDSNSYQNSNRCGYDSVHQNGKAVGWNADNCFSDVPKDQVHSAVCAGPYTVCDCPCPVATAPVITVDGVGYPNVPTVQAENDVFDIHWNFTSPAEVGKDPYICTPTPKSDPDNGLYDRYTATKINQPVTTTNNAYNEDTFEGFIDWAGPPDVEGTPGATHRYTITCANSDPLCPDAVSSYVDVDVTALPFEGELTITPASPPYDVRSAITFELENLRGGVPRQNPKEHGDARYYYIEWMGDLTPYGLWGDTPYTGLGTLDRVITRIFATVDDWTAEVEATDYWGQTIDGVIPGGFDGEFETEDVESPQ